MRKPVAGEKVFVFQPETKRCKAHWVETSVTKTWLESGSFVFETNDSVDYLIYMLGTNDTKTKFNHPPELISQAITQKINWVKSYNKENGGQTKIILLAPPQINLRHLKATSKFYASSNEKILKLAEDLKVISQVHNTDFIDLSKILTGSIHDGVHLTVEDNQKIARLIASEILRK